MCAPPGTPSYHFCLYLSSFWLNSTYFLLKKQPKSLRKSLSYKSHLSLSECCTESVLPQYTVFFHYIFLMVDYSLGTVKVCWYSILFFQMRARFRRLLRRWVVLFAVATAPRYLTCICCSWQPTCADCIRYYSPAHLGPTQMPHLVPRTRRPILYFTPSVSKYAAASTASAQSF